MKIYVLSETKDVNVKVFNMITINEVKTVILKSIFHGRINTSSIVQHVIQIKNGIMIDVNVSAKSITQTKKIIVRILRHVFKRIVGIFDNS